jgi:hypothetical protein
VVRIVEHDGVVGRKVKLMKQRGLTLQPPLDASFWDRALQLHSAPSAINPSTLPSAPRSD